MKIDTPADSHTLSTFHNKTNLINVCLLVIRLGHILVTVESLGPLQCIVIRLLTAKCTCVYCAMSFYTRITKFLKHDAIGGAITEGSHTVGS